MNKIEQAKSIYDEGWRDYVNGLEQSLKNLEEDISEAKDMQDRCTDEWCNAIEHVLDDLANSVFSIHEPQFSKEADTKKLKELKKRLHEAYAEYKTAVQ